MSSHAYDAIVVGGGFFGCSVARGLSAGGERVLLLENEAELLRRASYVNQARVHNGYHYPRSLLTALRSRVNFSRFVEDYSDCVVRDFDKYYAVARDFSNVTAAQFRTFCERIGAPIAEAPKHIQSLFDRDRVDGVFRVREYAFDAVKLRARMVSALSEARTDVRVNARATRVVTGPGGSLEVEYVQDGEPSSAVAARVFNCTYSGLNALLAESGVATLPMKHELAEMPLIEPPEELRGLGVTVMCGPFFSVMPFPARGLHTLSHVRYTPHFSWHDRPDGTDRDSQPSSPRPRTHFPHMVRDAQRFLPCLARCRYVDSLWEVKTVLPSSEVDDSRPILFKRDHGLKNLVCVMGGKIDNVYDVLKEVEAWRPHLSQTTH